MSLIQLHAFSSEPIHHIGPLPATWTWHSSSVVVMPRVASEKYELELRGDAAHVQDAIEAVQLSRVVCKIRLTPPKMQVGTDVIVTDGFYTGLVGTIEKTPQPEDFVDVEAKWEEACFGDGFIGERSPLPDAYHVELRDGTMVHFLQEQDLSALKGEEALFADGNRKRKM